MAQGRSSKATNGEGGRENAVIGSAARVRGRVVGDGDLTIEGQVEGDITLRGDLTIASGGSATSNVEAESVVVAGSLEGDVSASGRVSVMAGARVRGNVTGQQVSIEDGAEFAGRLESDFELPAELSGSTSSGAAARRR